MNWFSLFVTLGIAALGGYVVGLKHGLGRLNMIQTYQGKH